MSGDKQRMTGWLEDPTLPVQFVEGSPGIQAVGIMTEGELLVLREPIHFTALPQKQFAESGLQDAADSSLQDLGSPTQEGRGRSLDDASPSMLESMLDRVETAFESAAQVVENVAGDMISPRSVPAANSSASIPDTETAP